MRVSLFEVLRSRIDGANVVDLFAGTGCLGLESLSRGAREAVFLDTDRRSLEAIRKNLEKLRFAGRATVLHEDAFRAVERLAPADVVFVDPPYRFFVEREPEMRRLVETLLSKVVTSGEGRVVVEHRPKEGLGEVAGGAAVDERVYGGTIVTLYAPGNKHKDTETQS
jgi:16S rRNA (guanine(966)-N(2))-methyltransferase RsmD